MGGWLEVAGEGMCVYIGRGKDRKSTLRRSMRQGSPQGDTTKRYRSSCLKGQ